MTQFGLAAVETVRSPDGQPEALTVARTNVDRALNTVDEALAKAVQGSEDPLDRMQYAARTRPMAQLRAARVILDRQVAQVERQTDPDKRQDAIKGALNGFGAMTGQPVSFLIEVERRSMALARRRPAPCRSACASPPCSRRWPRSASCSCSTAASPARRWRGSRRCGGQPARWAGAELDTRLSVATRGRARAAGGQLQPDGGQAVRRETRVAADRAALEETVEARTADLRAANARLEAVDRSRRRFFADVSHELRTPLTVILGECDLALRAGNRPVDHGPAFTTIRKRASASSCASRICCGSPARNPDRSSSTAGR